MPPEGAGGAAGQPRASAWNDKAGFGALPQNIFPSQEWLRVKGSPLPLPQAPSPKPPPPHPPNFLFG